jgi:hypothetical protein
MLAKEMYRKKRLASKLLTVNDQETADALALVTTTWISGDQHGLIDATFGASSFHPHSFFFFFSTPSFCAMRFHERPALLMHMCKACFLAPFVLLPYQTMSTPREVDMCAAHAATGMRSSSDGV